MSFSLKTPLPNICFVDIDGPFVTVRSHVGLSRRKGIMETFDPVAVGLFNRLAEQTNLHMVVSSSWRKVHPDLTSMETILRVAGFEAPMFSDFLFLCGERDLDMRQQDRTTAIRHPDKIRGDEVADWLERNDGLFDQYIIIDDDSDFHPHQLPRLVQADPDHGLSYENYRTALKLLGGKP